MELNEYVLTLKTLSLTTLGCVYVCVCVCARAREHTRTSMCHGTCVENTGQSGLLALAFHLDGDRVFALLSSTAQAR